MEFSLSTYSLRRSMRESYSEDALSLEWIEAAYTDWVSELSYLVLYHQKTVLKPKMPIDAASPDLKEYLAVKASKRGNDVYARRTEKRFCALSRCLVPVECAVPDRTQVLYVTLTYGRENTFLSCWENLSKDWNKFMAYMRRAFGSISVVRCFEAQADGYPHVHAVLWFHDLAFPVVTWRSRSGRLSRRVIVKDFIASLTDVGFVDVRVLGNDIRDGFKYLFKYLKKSIDFQVPKAVRTLAMCWFNRIRSFSVTGWIRRSQKEQNDLITGLRNSNKVCQVSLEGEAISEEKWILIGCFCCVEGSAEAPFPWYISLTFEQGQKLEALKSSSYTSCYS